VGFSCYYVEEKALRPGRERLLRKRAIMDSKRAPRKLGKP